MDFSLTTTVREEGGGTGSTTIWHSFSSLGYFTGSHIDIHGTKEPSSSLGYSPTAHYCSGVCTNFVVVAIPNDWRCSIASASAAGSAAAGGGAATAPFPGAAASSHVAHARTHDARTQTLAPFPDLFPAVAAKKTKQQEQQTTNEMISVIKLISRSIRFVDQLAHRL